VCGASSIVVSFYAGGEVLCGADVETAASARKDVDVIHLNTIRLKSGVMMPLWLAMSERVHRESNLDEPESLDKLGAPFDSSHSITDTFSGLP
jgi:hypothetical protein